MKQNQAGDKIASTMIKNYRIAQFVSSGRPVKEKADLLEAGSRIILRWKMPVFPPSDESQT